MSMERLEQGPRRRWGVVLAAWAAAFVVACPVIFHWTAPAAAVWPTRMAFVFCLAVAAVLCGLFYRTEIKRVGRAQAMSLVVILAVVTLVSCYLHHVFVDHGHYFGMMENTEWQLSLQRDVVRLSPAVLPHSYRFLPNALVYWFQMAGVDFNIASQVYRVLVGLVLFYALYRFARRYTTHKGAMLAVVLAGLVYPVSFVEYAGQLTDPLSHLSFLLAFLFLETGDFPLFLTTLLIGSLAKETVLGMMGFYLLFCWKERRFALKAVVLCVACLGAYIGVRMYVLHGAMQYNQVSGVGIEHLRNNMRRTSWIPHFLLTAGAYAPFLFLGWRTTPLILKRLSFYLLAVLFLSSWFFSWLSEGRNFMPLVFVLSVVAARFIVAQSSAGAMEQEAQTV